jgi:NADPH:quinone reductase-like Zn-dependent oxidoreductase/SAM-dependent methyltransferase
MKALGEEYRQLLSDELSKLSSWCGPSNALFVSSVTGDALDPCIIFDPEYWVENLTSPVRFSSAVRRLIELKGDGIFLEIGPHSTLAGPLRQIASDISRPCNYVSVLTRGQDGTKTLLASLGRLFQESVSLDFTSFFQNGKVHTDLPTYAWDRSRTFWYESRVAQAWRMRKHPHHCLLGARVPESPDTAPQWRNVLYLEDEQWISDHRVRNDVVFPFAGYVAMAGEAVRQCTGIGDGYRIRHAVAHTALVLTDARGAELITTLRRKRLTDSEDSDWFEFNVTSFNGTAWVKHCDGQIAALGEPRTSSGLVNSFPRKVNASRFYEYMDEVGINFGPVFRRLKNVTASTTQAAASAEIAELGSEQNKPYTMHPATIDACFQLLILGIAQGMGRNIKQLSVPTMIEDLDVYSSSESLTAHAWGRESMKAEGVECVGNGMLALRLSGFQLTPIEDSLDIDYDIYAAARLEWMPDFDFVDVAPLFKPPPSDRDEARMLEELTLLCIIDSIKKIDNLTPGQPHFYKFRDWLHREVGRAFTGSNPLVPDSASYLSLSTEDRRAQINCLYEELMKRQKVGLAQGLKRICDNVEHIFTGEAETIDVLMQDKVLAQLYNAVSFGYSDFVRLLSSTKPTLRILEVGAGTGGTTELILRDLMHEGGLPRYSTYTFSDISAGFFPQAKERFAYAPNMEYKVFDISKDPVQQEFALGSYDLIVAANVVHATPSLKESLINLNRLLRPNGILVLTEICTQLRSPTYIFGNFSGWWLGEGDGRIFEPYVPVERWDKELRAAGFTGVDTAVYDEDAPFMCCTTIMARRKWDKPDSSKSVSIVASQADSGLVKALTDTLSVSDWSVSVFGINDDLPADQDIISCVDIENNFFEDINEDSFISFQKLLRSLGSQRLLWLTSPVQIKCKDPRPAQTIGASRTIRSELGIQFHTLEIDKTEPEFSHLVLRVFDKIRREEDDNNLVADKEFVVNDGIICIGRYHPFSLADELSQRSIVDAETIRAIEIGKAGQIESLRWKETSLPPLPDDCVVIEPKAVGLNLRDILVAMGVINAAGSSHIELGLETAGVIKRVGSNVKDFAIGDRVFAFAPDGCLATEAILAADLVAKIPDQLSFEEAATVPVVFATAIQCLLNIARIEKGQSVLIHSGCGGVGMSAIQICKMVEAEIFVTVGSDEKVEYLMQHYGIPRNRIFYSRDASFLSRVLEETGGRGVDVVLNSLSGNLLHTSWKCVAEFGTMLEIGKRDLIGYGELDMRPFLGNRTYSCFDGVEFASQRPKKLGQ